MGVGSADTQGSLSRVDERAWPSRGGTAFCLTSIVLAIAAVPWMIRMPAQSSPSAVAPGIVTVDSVVATRGDVNLSIDAPGTVTPLASVMIKARVNGELTQLAVEEGQLVRQNDFLAQIDPRPYQAALKQAQGRLARDQALLEQAQLGFPHRATPDEQDDDPQQQGAAQQARVRQYQGAVAADQAAVDAAKFDLASSRITSPLSGRVGLRQVDPGNYVQVGDDRGLATVTQIDPISVIFTVPEDQVQDIVRRMRAKAPLQVTAFDRSGTTHLAAGRLQTIDSQVDAGTGTVKLRALFDNKDFGLFPNQMVNAHLQVESLHNVVVVPASAVRRDTHGAYVYLIKAGETVTLQPVSLGPLEGNRQAISAGVEPGDRVVTGGTYQLREGAKVSSAESEVEADAGDPPSESRHY